MLSHAGVAGDFIASCITYEMRCARVGGDRGRRDFLANVFHAMNTWLHARGWAKVRHGFTEANLGIKGRWTYPTLATKFKAASVRQMCFYMNERYKNWHDGGEMGRTIAAAAWALCDFLWQLDGQGTFVDENLIPEVCVCARFFLESYHALHFAAWPQQALFLMRPKLHAFHHIICMLETTGLNPVRASCFRDEDWLGKFKKTSARCHGKTVHFKSLARYLPYIHMRAQKREKSRLWLL